MGAVDRKYLERKTELYLKIDPDRREMYERHRDQEVKVWPFFEYAEKPATVAFQNSVLYSMSYLKKMKTYAGKLACWISGRDSTRQ